MLALLPPTAPSKYTETLNESGQVYLEGEGGITAIDKLLEEAGLDERIGLYTLGLLHRHFEPLGAHETRTHLQIDPQTECALLMVASY